MWTNLFMSDLKRLWVSPQNWLAMILYCVIVLLLIHFSLPPAQGRSISLGVSALWIALLLGSVIGLPSLQHHPDARRFLSQLATSTFSPTGYFWEKCLVGMVILGLGVMVLIVPATVLYGFPVRVELLMCLGVLGLGCIGLSVVVTLCVSLTTGQGTWLLPLMAFPMLVPVLMAGTRVMTALLEPGTRFPNSWFMILISYDVLMLSVASLLSEFLWEEIPR